MKVVITLPVGERLGGAENMLWTFLRHVDRRRIEPFVVFLHGGPFEREVASLGIGTTVLHAGRLRHIATTARTITTLAQFLRRDRPPLLLNWMGKAQVYGASAAIIAGIGDRIVWWQHGVPSAHWLDRLATILPARAIGCSSRAAASAQERMRPRRPTFVVHPGIDSPPPTSEQALTLRRQFSIPDEAIVLGIVGRLQPWKGQHHFIHALATLRERGHDVRGFVVGGNAYNLSPGYDEHVHDLARTLGVEKYVLFTGQVEDALPYIAGMDALVNASDPEPFGIVVIEAMALGVPVVAVGTGGPAEIIEPGRSGLLVPRSAPDVLADALEPLVQDSELRLRLGLGGRERYRERFSAVRMADALQSRLEELGQ